MSVAVDFLSEMRDGGAMFENHYIRTIYHDPDGWLFHGPDLVKAIGYTNPDKLAAKLLKKVDEKHIRATHPFRMGSSQTRYATFLTRAGAIEFIYTSKMPAGRRMRDWINGVIESIIDHGGYHVDPEIQQQIEQLNITVKRLQLENNNLTNNLTSTKSVVTSMANLRVGQLVWRNGLEMKPYRRWHDVCNKLVAVYPSVFVKHIVDGGSDQYYIKSGQTRRAVTILTAIDDFQDRD